MPLELLGDLISTFIWVGVVLAAGALSKNSLLTILIALGLFIALFFGGSVFFSFLRCSRRLKLCSGSGATGTLNVAIRTEHDRF